MSSATASSTLTADCTQCGGSVPIALAGPEPSCRYCGNPDPFEPGIRSRLQSMRARLGHRAAKQRQLTGELVATAGYASFAHVSILITCWLLFGGMAFGFAVYGHGIDFVTFASGPPPEAELSGEWWTLFALAVAFPLSLGMWGLMMFRLRGLSAEALPPAYPGAPPRCRCCGADLPAGTALRRCVYCQADNMVTGERYRRSVLDLDRALDRTAKGFSRSLERRLSAAGTAAMVSAMAPIALLLVVPVAGLIAGVTMPELWPIAAGCAVFGLVGLLLPWFRRVPKIEPLTCVALETKLNVGSTIQQVNGQLHVPMDGRPPRIYSLIGDQSRTFERTMYVDEEGERRDRIVVHELVPGGQPLAEAEQPRLIRAELWQPGSSMSEGVDVQTVYLVRHRKGGFRLWQGEPPTVGQPPQWTANRMKDRPIIYFP